MPTEAEMRAALTDVLANTTTSSTEGQVAIGDGCYLYACPETGIGPGIGTKPWIAPHIGDPCPQPNPWVAPYPPSVDIYPTIPSTEIFVPPTDKAIAEKLGAAMQLIKTVHTLLKQGNLRTALKLVRDFLKENK